MIEDKELRNLFKIESEERLQHLDDGLLRLEQTPSDQKLLEDLFREAHSLKGAARMLGLTPIQDMAHQLEDAFGAAKKGEAALGADAVAGMNQTLSVIRNLVLEAIGEAVPEVESEGSESEPSGVTGPSIQQEPSPEATAPHAAVVQPQAAPASPAAESRMPKPEGFRIETIRVEPKRLDALLSQVGELSVTKMHLAHRLSDIEELQDYCEERCRRLHQAQFRLNCVEHAGECLEFLKESLGRLRNAAYEDSARLDYISGQLEDGIRNLRLLPMSTLFALFPRLVHDLAQELRKQISLVVEGEDTVADKLVLEEMKDPLMHILRNAVDHGIESPEQREQAGKPRGGTIRLRASQTHDRVIIEISDDGRGLDVGAIRNTALTRGLYREDELNAMSAPELQSLILVSGFSTSGFITDLSGRGVGLDVVRNNIERLKGSLQIESSPGKGLVLRAHLPVTLATVRMLIVTMNGLRYALPAEYVQFSRKLLPQDVYTMEGRRTISVNDQPVSVAWLDELLEIAGSVHARDSRVVCVVLRIGTEQFGLLLDDAINEQEVMMKPQSKLLKRVRNVSGATILEDGEVCMVLNPYDLFKTLCKRPALAAEEQEAEAAPARKVLLLAEDSITTRTQEKRILENAGYEVVTAVDGMDAYNKLASRDFDGVVSDINMPNMTGLELAARIRADRKYAELPVILVTSLSSDEDRRRGLDAGANAYISKPEFDQHALLDCLRRLV